MKPFLKSIIVVGIAAITTLGFLGVMATQIAYTQATTSTIEDLNVLITTITGIITTIAVLAGGIIASFAKMSQKLGLAKENEIEKMLFLGKELESSDHWGKEMEERLVAICDVVSALSGGEKILQDKRINLKKWQEEASDLQDELDTIYKKLIPLLAKK